MDSPNKSYQHNQNLGHHHHQEQPNSQSMLYNQSGAELFDMQINQYPVIDGFAAHAYDFGDASSNIDLSNQQRLQLDAQPMYVNQAPLPAQNLSHSLEAIGPMSPIEGYHPMPTNPHTPSRFEGVLQAQAVPHGILNDQDDAAAFTNQENDPFWNAVCRLQMSGQDKTESNAQVYYKYHFPDLRKNILGQLHAWRKEPHQLNYARPLGEVFQPHGNPGQDIASSSDGKSGGRKKRTRTVRRPPRFNDSGSVDLHPKYESESSLSTSAECHEYLSHPDPAYVYKLNIRDDDWKHVKETSIDTFTGRIFEAVFHDYAQSPPEGIKLIKEKQEKYEEQQAKYINRILEETVSAIGVKVEMKRLKAQCRLLVDAAISFHEIGVHDAIWQEYSWFIQQERQVDRKCKLDIESICSVRLEKIVQVVEANKMVAFDVVKGNNFHRIVQDPDSYLIEKIQYLKSNTTRQTETVRLSQIDGGVVRKRKANALPTLQEVAHEEVHIDEEQDPTDDDGGADDGDPDDEYTPRVEVKRQKRAC